MKKEEKIDTYKNYIYLPNLNVYESFKIRKKLKKFRKMFLKKF